jgi:4-hydroxybenzoate polyprenyltransferase
MRGAGCTVNDIVDRDFDGRVARTATRPIASGQIRLWQAFVFLGLQLLVGLWVLVHFNGFAIVLGISSLALVALYPFMKRITYWPQLFLGLTFNWGALMGWAVIHGSLGPPAYLLYAAGVFWTLGYDTIYAHQDKEDDVLIGVKSTALKFGNTTKAWVFMFYGGAIVLLAVAGAMAGLTWPFYVAMAAASGHLAWQVKALKLDDPKDCLAKFKSNRDVGIIILIGIVAGRLVI